MKLGSPVLLARPFPDRLLPATTDAFHALLVSRDKRNAARLSNLLRDAGVRFEVVESGDSALALLQTTSFDIILSDFCLPGSNVLAFSERLSAAYPDIPLVLIAHEMDPAQVRAALRSGAADVVSPPQTCEVMTVIVTRNVERRRLDVQRIQETSRMAFLRSLRSLAAAIDAREHHTARHSRRVAELARTMGYAFGLSAGDMEVLTIAARVHDVGKIGVPDQILNKPGPLTKSEWEVMRAHATIGADIVAEVPELSFVATVVRHHHERLDGAGYPDGLSGEQIPFFSRIIAVADAYECMTSNRTYRTKLPIATAYNELRNGAGTQFDRQIVERFLSLQMGGKIPHKTPAYQSRCHIEHQRLSVTPPSAVSAGSPGSPS